MLCRFHLQANIGECSKMAILLKQMKSFEKIIIRTRKKQNQVIYLPQPFLGLHQSIQVLYLVDPFATQKRNKNAY